MKMTAEDLLWAASMLQQGLDDEIRSFPHEESDRILSPDMAASRKLRHAEQQARIDRIKRAAIGRMRRDVKAGR